MFLADLLVNAARRWPDKLAAVFPHERVTYAELEQHSRSVAAELNRLGIGPGKRVAILHDNTLAALIYYWGILRSGAVTVDIPTSAGHATIVAALDEAQPSALAIQPAYLKQLAVELAGTCQRAVLSTANAAEFAGPLLARGQSFHALEAMLERKQALPEARAGADPSTVAMTIYTSGTTGRAKGVMLSHANLLFNASTFNSQVGLTNQDSLLLVAPLYYIHGRIQLLTYTMLGGTIFFSAGFRFPQAVLQELVRYAPTTFSGVPYHYSMLLTHSKLRSTQLPSLRKMMITGGALSPARLRELQEAVPHVALHINYGMTESSPRLTHLGPSDEVFARPTSCGRALPGVTLEILGEAGEPLPGGAIGEVVAGGPGIMTGYVSGDEHASGRIDARGRLRTGDLGYLDADGHLFLIGRSSEMIKSAGERLFPGEIEDVLQRHPGVGESAVFGVPDPALGERVVACVVPAPGHDLTPEDLKTHCLTALSYVRVPKEVHIVAELPKTPSGKIKRNALRARFASPDSGRAHEAREVHA
jgi:long-chain acyl-CoA synthetase